MLNLIAFDLGLIFRTKIWIQWPLFSVLCKQACTFQIYTPSATSSPFTCERWKTSNLHICGLKFAYKTFKKFLGDWKADILIKKDNMVIRRHVTTANTTNHLQHTQKHNRQRKKAVLLKNKIRLCIWRIFGICITPFNLSVLQTLIN